MNKTTDDESFEDRVLLGINGPIYIYGTPDDHQGVVVRLTGRMHDWEPYVAAADRLVKQGLLTTQPTGDPINLYAFTERGRIAHWALREAFLK